MKTYTESQKAQLINFYQQWLPHVEAFGYENLPHGSHEFYRHGKKFFKDHQAAEAAAAKVAARKGRVPLTEAELRPILSEYLETYLDNGSKVKVFDRRKAAEGVNNTRPEPLHTVMGVHGQIVTRDNMNASSEAKLDRMGNTLKDLLAEYNEKVGFERFAV